ncbi:hypothetical protein RHMOL_Rhmol05G0044900 [Rhododendron molle]|uniref:Uncharacterized protein n=1 Tax=Rhododendron molle TaxID=49168 RepID=A0ACC0NLX6_RHOML|nr:hypothetical protein RHMOL_Rhmol05G0044900 [Rhododendron molle]
MYICTTLGIKFRRGRSFNLKKYIEMEEANLAERIDALDKTRVWRMMRTSKMVPLSLWNFNSIDWRF